MPTEPKLSATVSSLEHLPQIPHPVLRTIDFPQIINNVELELSPAAPNNGIVCVRAVDGANSQRILNVTEVAPDGTLVPWDGSELLVDFKARKNRDWSTTLVIVAVDTRGSTPRAETKTSRVKLKGTVYVGDPDE